MKKLKIFESIDVNSEQVQHLIQGIKNFYNEFGNSVEPLKDAYVGEDGAKAWALEQKFLERYEGTNFNDIIQYILKDDKDFIYKEFLKILK